MIARLALVLALVTGVTVGACTLFDDDLPDTSCESNEDCFESQGEVCDLDAHACVTTDAGVP